MGWTAALAITAVASTGGAGDGALVESPLEPVTPTVSSVIRVSRPPESLSSGSGAFLPLEPSGALTMVGFALSADLFFRASSGWGFVWRAGDIELTWARRDPFASSGAEGIFGLRGCVLACLGVGYEDGPWRFKAVVTGARLSYLTRRGVVLESSRQVGVASVHLLADDVSVDLELCTRFGARWSVPRGCLAIAPNVHELGWASGITVRLGLSL